MDHSIIPQVPTTTLSHLPPQDEQAPFFLEGEVELLPSPKDSGGEISIISSSNTSDNLESGNLFTIARVNQPQRSRSAFGRANIDTSLLESDENLILTIPSNRPPPGSGDQRKRRIICKPSLEPMEPLRPLWQGRKLARRIVVDNPKASIINQMLKLPDPKIVPAPVSLNIAFPNNLPQDDAMICAGLGRVLVIDDSLMTLKVMVRRLGNAGFVVESAPNGYFGLQMMQNKLYDCVYLDLEMPVMDGFDCARNIRNWEASVGRNQLQTICALTSSTGEAVEMKTKGSGFDNFVSKPADIKTVLALCSSSSPGDVELENQFEDEDGVGKTQIFLAPKFVRGVEVQCRDASSAIYYNGSVMKHNGNLTYTILYEDGQVEECVRELRMRYPNQVQKASLEVSERSERGFWKTSIRAPTKLTYINKILWLALASPLIPGWGGCRLFEQGHAQRGSSWENKDN